MTNVANMVSTESMLTTTNTATTPPVLCYVNYTVATRLSPFPPRHIAVHPCFNLVFVSSRDGYVRFFPTDRTFFGPLMSTSNKFDPSPSISQLPSAKFRKDTRHNLVNQFQPSTASWRAHKSKIKLTCLGADGVVTCGVFGSIIYWSNRHID